MKNILALAIALVTSIACHAKEVPSIAKLDKRLAFYASDEAQGGCTTVDEISISITGGANPKNYKYTDESCDTSEMKDVLTIWKLVSRAENQQSK